MWPNVFCSYHSCRNVLTRRKVCKINGLTREKQILQKKCTSLGKKINSYKRNMATKKKTHKSLCHVYHIYMICVTYMSYFYDGQSSQAQWSQAYPVFLIQPFWEPSHRWEGKTLRLLGTVGSYTYAFAH